MAPVCVSHAVRFVRLPSPFVCVACGRGARAFGAEVGLRGVWCGAGGFVVLVRGAALGVAGVRYFAFNEAVPAELKPDVLCRADACQQPEVDNTATT